MSVCLSSSRALHKYIKVLGFVYRKWGAMPLLASDYPSIVLICIKLHLNEPKFN